MPVSYSAAKYLGKMLITTEQRGCTGPGNGLESFRFSEEEKLVPLRGAWLGDEGLSSGPPGHWYQQRAVLMMETTTMFTRLSSVSTL